MNLSVMTSPQPLQSVEIAVEFVLVLVIDGVGGPPRAVPAEAGGSTCNFWKSQT